MSHPEITWCVIVGILLLSFSLEALYHYREKRHHKHLKHRHVVEIGRDSEMFFIPGDKDYGDEFDD